MLRQALGVIRLLLSLGDGGFFPATRRWKSIRCTSNRRLHEWMLGPCWEKRHLYGILGGNGIMSKPDVVQEQWLDQWAERIDDSGLTIVALPLLEIGRGLGFIASHILLLVQPLLATVVDKNSVSRYIDFLEDPAAVESLIERVERKAKSDG